MELVEHFEELLGDLTPPKKPKLLVPLPARKPVEERHQCTIKTVNRHRVTGFLVVCALGCEPLALCRSMRQARRLAWSHEESRRLGIET